jgi:outer membrane biosynthesis protein TonB
MVKSPSKSLKIAVLIVGLIALFIGPLTDWYSYTVGIIAAIIVWVGGFLALKMVIKTPEEGQPQAPERVAPPVEQPGPAEPTPEQPAPEPAPAPEPQEQEPKPEQGS